MSTYFSPRRLIDGRIARHQPRSSRRQPSNQTARTRGIKDSAPKISQRDKDSALKMLISSLNAAFTSGRTLYGRTVRSIGDFFDTVDQDGGGSLDRAELGAALRRMGLGLRQTHLDALMTVFDEDGGGEVDKDEFTQILEWAGWGQQQQQPSWQPSSGSATARSVGSGSPQSARSRQAQEQQEQLLQSTYTNAKRCCQHSDADSLHQRHLIQGVDLLNQVHLRLLLCAVEAVWVQLVHLRLLLCAVEAVWVQLVYLRLLLCSVEAVWVQLVHLRLLLCAVEAVWVQLERMNGGPYRDSAALMSSATSRTLGGCIKPAEPVIGDWLQSKLRAVYVVESEAQASQAAERVAEKRVQAAELQRQRRVAAEVVEACEVELVGCLAAVDQLKLGVEELSLKEQEATLAKAVEAEEAAAAVSQQLSSDQQLLQVIDAKQEELAVQIVELERAEGAAVALLQDKESLLQSKLTRLSEDRSRVGDENSRLHLGRVAAVARFPHLNLVPIPESLHAGGIKDRFQHRRPQTVRHF